MEVEIKISGREDVKDSERQSINVETHALRGDIYNVMKVDTMMENDTATFKVPAGGRLMIQLPEGESEVVYDAAQGAAVRRGSQRNDEGVADAPEETLSMKAPDRPIGRVHTPPQSLADKAKAEAEAKAKAQQQSGSGRPAGETPPKPGSPVGSPPSGNEGNK